MAPKLKQPDYDAYRLLVQEVKDYAIFMLDISGRIVTWNAGAQRLKGYTADEIIGKHFSIFYDKENLANKKPQHELEKATTEGRVEDEGWRLRKDGTRFWANVVITALHDEKGNLKGFSKITRDMTEHRNAEEALRKQAVLLEQRVAERTAELEKANRSKDEFITTLSHELRTPLTSITGWVQMLEAGELTQTQQRKAFEVIDRNLTAQAQLIDDLLNVSRIVTGKMTLELQPLYPAPIIEEAMDSIRPTVKAKNLKLTQDLDAGLGPMQIDPARFHQIVWNLLTNAVKFTPKKGHIHVSLKRINSNALLQISDSGEGIDPEFIPFIFERFRQADASRSRKYGGLGVGLSIAKSLVEQHGGAIYAESAGVGKGSTFNVTLPIPALSSDCSSASKQTGTGKSMLKGARILVVEDEPDTREMIAHAVKQRGAKPVEADSAQKALQLLEQEPCDLVISDIGMPDLDGYAFIRKLRSLKSPASKVPAIALTAYAGEYDRKLSIEAGFNTHIPKPITLTELVRVISKLIGGRRN
jgi:PAS domain S-box-containing protein